MRRGQPPQSMIDEAIDASLGSPCAKSQRGVVIWDPTDPQPLVDAIGWNGQPEPFKCDGSAACREACAKLCEHAEASALRDLMGDEGGLHMLHVKTVNGALVPSGGPSCWQCSRSILADKRIVAVWLFHEDGWACYEAIEFHTITLRACGLPVLR